MATLLESDGHFFPTSTPVETTATSNPFYVDVERNEVAEMEKKELYGQHERVLILCLSRIAEADFDPTSIADPELAEGVLEKAWVNLTLVPSSMQMLHIKRHMQSARRIDSEHLASFNHRELELAQTELVVMMPTLHERYADRYSKLFTGAATHQDLVETVVMATMYDSSWHSAVKRGIEQIKYQITDAHYWSGVDSMTVNDSFVDRRFQFKKSLSQTVRASALSAMKFRGRAELIDALEKTATDGANYLQYLWRKELYQDASDAVRKSGKQVFRLNDAPLPFSSDQMVELFRLVARDQRMVYTLFNSFAVSKEMYTLVTHNAEILELMQPLFTKLPALYRYLLGYPMLAAYLTEGIKKTFIRDDEEVIWSINAASKLPWCPFADDPKMSPYFPLMVSDELLNWEGQFRSAELLQNRDYGIVDLNTFQQHFELFTGSMLDGFDWTGFAATGSCLAACCPRVQPLEETLEKPTDKMAAKARFFDEYYGDSDVDMMVEQTKSVFDFCDRVRSLETTVRTNLEKKTPGGGESLKIIPQRTVAMTVTPEYIEKHMPGTDLATVVEQLKTPVGKEAFYPIYITNKYRQSSHYRKKFAEEGRANALYDDFFKAVNIDSLSVYIVDGEMTSQDVDECDNELYFYRSDFDSSVAKSDDRLLMKISEGIKFKLESPQMPRSFEVFSIKFNFASCVSRFHLPCVRGWYTGTDVRLLPSAVYSYMTFIAPDYKYFAGIRDPITILNKYRRRGFSTVLNDREKMNVVEYNSTADEWNKVYHLDAHSKESVEAHFGPVALDHALFRPSVTEKELPADGLYRNVVDPTYSTADSVIDHYRTLGYDETTSPVKMLRFRTIDSKGYVAPFQMWLLDAAYSLL